MNIPLHRYTGAAALASALLLGACDTGNLRLTEPNCALPEGHDLDLAFAAAETGLRDGCAHRFDDYMAQLLHVAEGDPGPDNRRRFSEFLESAANDGIISRRQAKQHYNRYFNVKFVSLMGDYNNCSQTCTRRQRVLSDMERELLHKEQGLLKVSGDAQSYYRADRLMKETELVLQATCLACEAGP